VSPNGTPRATIEAMIALRGTKGASGTNPLASLSVIIHALERCHAPVLRFKKVAAPDQMKPSLDRPCFSRRTQRAALCPAYLPDGVNLIYLPLVPLARIEWIAQLHLWWTAVVWGGLPAGYTTL
jgi:hypothetical protein